MTTTEVNVTLVLPPNVYPGAEGVTVEVPAEDDVRLTVHEVEPADMVQVDEDNVPRVFVNETVRALEGALDTVALIVDEEPTVTDEGEDDAVIVGVTGTVVT